MNSVRKKSATDFRTQRRLFVSSWWKSLADYSEQSSINEIIDVSLISSVSLLWASCARTSPLSSSGLMSVPCATKTSAGSFNMLTRAFSRIISTTSVSRTCAASNQALMGSITDLALASSTHYDGGGVTECLFSFKYC